MDAVNIKEELLMQTIPLLPELKTAPAVFAVGNEYQIMVPARNDLLLWVTVGEQTFYDHVGGIMRSAVPVHRVHVPMTLLDRAGAYTVHYKKMIDRTPYFPQSEEEVCATYPFRPVPTDAPIHIYHLADTHGNFEFPAAAGSYFGEDIDLLVLNGDIPNHSGDLENFDLIYTLAEAVTGGQRAVVFSRGNHDMRGIYAEKLIDYVPHSNGKSYFTFRVGSLWGIVLDCGEDKLESHEEYNYTNVSHVLRREQTAFIKDVIDCAELEYNAAGVAHRLVISHNPFTCRYPEPFNIEEELYGEWLRLLAAHVKPDLLLAGHTHKCEVKPEGGKLDAEGRIPVVVGSRPLREEKVRTGHLAAALILDEKGAEVRFTDHKGEVKGTHFIEKVR
jgi:predicted phosphodiesterase